MEGFVKFKDFVRWINTIGVMHHITVLLSPGGVVDLGNNILNSPAGRIPAKIKTDRIHAVAKVSKMREQSNRPLGRATPFAFDQCRYRGFERLLRITQVIPPTKPRQCGSRCRPQPVPIEELGQFINVNRGFGFLGYPGRVGIWPEITVITLKKTGLT